MVVHHSPDGFDDGDEIVRFAEVHGMKVRGHCVAYDHNNPKWLGQGHFTPKKLSQLLHAHISSVMKHYAGKVSAWDVVNEALDQDGR